MGDCCYMELVCREADQPKFEDLGFRAYDDDVGKDLVKMIDEEANYAHAGDLPVGIPYFGSHTDGGGYCHMVFACDGKEIFEAVTTREAAGPVVEMLENGSVDDDDAVAAARYWLALAKAKQMLGLAEAPVPPPQLSAEGPLTVGVLQKIIAGMADSAPILVRWANDFSPADSDPAVSIPMIEAAGPDEYDPRRHLAVRVKLVPLEEITDMDDLDELDEGLEFKCRYCGQPCDSSCVCDACEKKG